MMGRPQRGDPRLFYVGFNLEGRVPPDHPLRKIAAAVDFSFVRAKVAGLYGTNGHESVDPTLILKLLFLAFFERVRSERELMRLLPMRLDWLWFCGLDLDSPVPDHSVLSKARRRWGLAVFEEVFAHVLGRCVEAGLVEGRTAHADSTVLKANAAVESRVPRVLWNQLEAGLDPQPPPGGSDPGRTPPPPQDSQSLPPQRDPAVQQRPSRFNARSVSRTDPDATTLSRRGRRAMLAYKDHRLLDDRCGIITATVATAADYDDGTLLTTLLDQHRRYLGAQPVRAVADSAYGTRANYKKLPGRGVEPCLKPRPGNKGSGGWLGRLPQGLDPRQVLRRLKRRSHLAEGSFAEAHTRLEHRRCRWRRRWRVQIQCYLIAAVQNLKKLARSLNPQRQRPAVVLPPARVPSPISGFLNPSFSPSIPSLPPV